MALFLSSFAPFWGFSIALSMVIQLDLYHACIETRNTLVLILEETSRECNHYLLFVFRAFLGLFCHETVKNRELSRIVILY